MKHRLLLSFLLATQPAWADGSVPLKPGPGQDLTARTCNTCHTSNYIVMNSPFLTATQWQAELDKMRNDFGARLDDQTEASIEAYLTANYATK
jgi:sulfite dehydrogenase (cytochrome) subunit B